MLQVTNLTKEYPTPRGPVPVLADVSFSLAPGDGAAIMGPSGAGKSSLLYILGALEPPTSGTVTLDGRNPCGCPRYPPIPWCQPMGSFRGCASLLEFSHI